MKSTETRRRLTPTVVIWLAFQSVVVAAVGLVLLSTEVFAARPAGDLRAGLLFAGSVVILIRMAVTSLILLPRRMEAGEAVAVGAWIAIIHLTYALVGRTTTGALGVLGWAGVALFVAGSAINTGSEIQRMRFKRRTENAGQLYTGGLFSLSMHINYFGDVLWSVGMALIAGSVPAAVIPVAMTVSFVWYHIPRLDAHLERKYGPQFRQYASETKKLIPWVY